MKKYLNKFYLDKEKDIVVSIFKDEKEYFYTIKTPNHHTANLISNLSKITKLELLTDNKNEKYIKNYLQGYITARNTIVYIMRFLDVKVADIYPDGSIIQKATIPAINKTLMSQTNDYKLPCNKTIIKTYIKIENKFVSDLHTHMNGNLSPDILIALGLKHEIAYPLYYVKKLNLKLTNKQLDNLNKQRNEVSIKFENSKLKGKYLDRKIDDNTFINFRDLILNNIENQTENINKIRNSLAILKDSQAVFTNLEKLYIYRYVFTKAKLSDKHVKLINAEYIEDDDIRLSLNKMIKDSKKKEYKNNSLFKDELLWIARSYNAQGIKYVEISNTAFVKNDNTMYELLNEIHEILPIIEKETGVMIRFLAAIRRMPLNIIKDQKTPTNYLKDNIDVLKAVSKDPYIVGCDIVGEEINDIDELEPVIKELVAYTKENPDFTIRIHAGENDSLKDNVSNSIKCIKNSLTKGQAFPKVRIGHGLYTENLNSKKGKQLIKDLKKNNVVLEFQLTSNVRLNNLTNILDFPLKKYIDNGIKCVQGSDGCGLYGITPMEEQLSLENLIKLNEEDIVSMCNSENEVINSSIEAFNRKEIAFRKFLNKRSIKKAIKDEIEKNKQLKTNLSLNNENKLNSEKVFKGRIKALPLDKLPIVIAGGSFNTAYRKTKTNNNDKKIIDKLLNNLDPNKVYFVIGNKMNGYEKYLVNKNKKFEIYSIVPSLIASEEYENIINTNVNICISIEMLRMAIYKSFNYEIFERRSSVLIVFDGNSAGANLIQEAKNGKGKGLIFVSKNATPLIDKALSLKGYVRLIDNKTNIITSIKKLY